MSYKNILLIFVGFLIVYRLFGTKYITENMDNSNQSQKNTMPLWKLVLLIIILIVVFFFFIYLFGPLMPIFFVW